MFETGVVRANECLSERQVGRHKRDAVYFRFSIA